MNDVPLFHCMFAGCNSILGLHFYQTQWPNPKLGCLCEYHHRNTDPKAWDFFKPVYMTQKEYEALALIEQ
jgi:hypothetical protein